MLQPLSYYFIRQLLLALVDVINSLNEFMAHSFKVKDEETACTVATHILGSSWVLLVTTFYP